MTAFEQFPVGNGQDGESAYPGLDRPRFEIVPIKGALEAAEYLPQRADIAISCSLTLGLENPLAPAEELSGRGFQVVPRPAALLATGTRHLDKLLRRRPGKRCVNAIKPTQLSGSS